MLMASDLFRSQHESPNSLMVLIWTMWTPWSVYYSSRAVFVPHHHHLQGHTKGHRWSVSRCNDSGARCKFLNQTFGRISAHWSPELGCWNSGIPNIKASWLRCPCCSHRDFEPPQGNQKEFFPSYQGSLRIWWGVLPCQSIVVSLFCPVNPKNGKAASMISKEIYEVVRDNAETLDSAIIYNRDFSYN